MLDLILEASKLLDYLAAFSDLVLILAYGHGAVGIVDCLGLRSRRIRGTLLGLERGILEGEGCKKGRTYDDDWPSLSGRGPGKRGLVSSGVAGCREGARIRVSAIARQRRGGRGERRTDIWIVLHGGLRRPEERAMGGRA